MSYYLWLDDDRAIPTNTVNEWVRAKNMAEFKEVLAKRGLPRYVSFDMDLNEKHYHGDYSDGKTGLDCVQYLLTMLQLKVSQDGYHPTVYYGVHSMNRPQSNLAMLKLSKMLGHDTYCYYTELATLPPPS